MRCSKKSRVLRTRHPDWLYHLIKERELSASSVVRRGGVVVGDINPDFLEVVCRLWRQFVALHLRLRFFFHFFLNAVISAWTCSAGMERLARIESIPRLILSRTSAFQTSSRCFRRRRPSRTTSLAVS